MGEAKKQRRREPSPSGKIGTLPHFIFGRDKAAEAAGVSENKFRSTIAAVHYRQALGARWTMSTPDGRQDGLGQSRHAPPGHDLALSSEAEQPAHVIGTLSHYKREQDRLPLTTLMVFPRPTVGFGG
jgi:hypothetical protein